MLHAASLCAVAVMALGAPRWAFFPPQEGAWALCERHSELVATVGWNSLPAVLRSTPAPASAALEPPGGGGQTLFVLLDGLSVRNGCCLGEGVGSGGAVQGAGVARCGPIG